MTGEVLALADRFTFHNNHERGLSNNLGITVMYTRVVKGSDKTFIVTLLALSDQLVVVNSFRRMALLPWHTSRNRMKGID